MLALFVLSPVLLLIAFLVRVKLGSPVIFRQQRCGKHCRLFTLLKFRTMTDECGPDGQLLPDHERLTSFGQFLRSTSLDELPGLWNVVRGDMSLVGPRPHLTDFLPLYNEREASRHDVMPGITGWAQINGRNAISWSEKFELDIWYASNVSFWLDVSILLRTVKQVVLRRDISAEGYATMPRFMGTQQSQDTGGR